MSEQIANTLLDLTDDPEEEDDNLLALHDAQPRSLDEEARQGYVLAGIKREGDLEDPRKASRPR
eukprot:4954699-Amphidinium_carterae.2